MGLVETGVRTISKRMPKMVSPKMHAVLDYAIAGSFFLAGAILWRRHRRAAIASIACGVAEAATAAVTDYPGGIRPMISLRTHERIDGALAGMVGAMPIAMTFSADEEAMLFRAQGVAIAALTGLTDWNKESFSDWQDVA